VGNLTLSHIKSMHRAPQMFEYLLLPNFADEFLDGGLNEELGLLLGMARTTVAYVAPDGYLDTFTKSRIQKVRVALLSVFPSFLLHNFSGIYSALSTIAPILL
jgi:hypothetical protein